MYLTISCVTFASNPDVLRDTLISLAHACLCAHEDGLLERVDLYLIDNGPDEKNLSTLTQLKNDLPKVFNHIHLITGHGNIGYGCGHNLAIHQVASDYHLIINPDVINDVKNIVIAIEYMEQHRNVGLLAPDAFCPDGSRQYIAKRQPEIIVLLARACGFKPKWKWLKRKMDRYEYRDLIPANSPIEIELASGCYMFCRTSTLQKVKGFDPKYFMYFEDFDLSKKIKIFSNISHLPNLQIVHAGGGAARKGFSHIFNFFKSLCQFFIGQNF